MWTERLEQLAQEVVAMYYVTPRPFKLPDGIEEVFDQHCAEHGFIWRVDPDSKLSHRVYHPDDWGCLLTDSIKNTEHPLRGILLLSICYEMQWRLSRSEKPEVDDITTQVRPWVQTKIGRAHV